MFPVITIPRRRKGKQGSRETPPQEIGAAPLPVHASDARRYVNGVSATVAAVVWVIGVISAIVLDEVMRRGDLVPAVLIPTVLIGLFLLFSIKVVDQWEKAVVLRFGKYHGLRGPGLF